MKTATKTHSRIHLSRPRTSCSLRSAARLGLGLLSLLSLSAGTVAHAGTVTWDGTTADWFANPSHWVGGAYPGAGDDAVNMSTAAMTLGQSTIINSFFSNGAFSLQGGTFSGNQANAASTLQVNNVFTDDGGQINNFTVNQGTNGSVVFTTSGGNSVSGDVFNAGVDMSASNAYVRMFNTNTFNGSVSLGAGGANGIHLYDSNANFVLNGGLTGFGSVVQDNGGATLTNNGTINANSAANPLTLALTTYNTTGMTEATNGGTLNLQNTNTNAAAGSTLAATGTGSVVSISGTFTGTGSNLITASNGGQIHVNGAALLGTINTDANTALVFDTNGGNTLSNTTVNGNLDLAANGNAYVRLFNTDTVNGSVSLGASGANGIHLYDGNTNFVIGANGSLTGFGGVVQDNGGATLANNGTINANSAGQTLNLALANFNNNGLAEATNGGTLSLANTNTNAAAGSTLAASGNGSVVSIAGTFTGTGSNLITATNGGQVQVNGAALLGTINTDAATALVFNTDGNNALSNTTVNGNLDLAANGNAYVRMFNTDTVNGTVTLGASGANGIHLYDGNTNFVVGATGALSGFGDVNQDNGGATLTNNGMVNAGGGTLNINVDHFANTGTTTVQNGATLNVNGGNTDSGNILVKQGGTATFAQGLTQTAGLTQADGTLNSPLTLTGGTLSGTGTVNGNVANSGGTVSAGNSASPFGTLAVNGTFSQTSGVLNAVFSSTQNSLLAVNGAVTTGGVLNVDYLGSSPYTGSGPFTFLDYGSLTSSITGTGPTQYFSNETFDSSENGLIMGSNGFLYELINNTSADGLQLEVLTNGAPTPAVPEASTTVSMGLLLLLGSGLVLVKPRRPASFLA